MATIARNNQLKIYKILSEQWVSISRSNQQHAIDTLQQVWDLSALPSNDDRYDNALGDLIQHYFNNDDWSIDYLFSERFNVYENGTVFQKFIEAVLRPENYSSPESLAMVSDQVDSILSNDKLRLVTEEFNNRGLPVQRVQQKTIENDLPLGVKRNDIPFYLNSGNLSISEQEYFLLDPVTNWNDYGVVSKFGLTYYKHMGLMKHIGYFKIIHEEENHTYLQMEPRFLKLSDKFCSLAWNDEFYLNIRESLGENGMISVLYALKDAAYFTDICDKWEGNSNFKHSLIRDNDAERMLRNLKPILKGHDLSEAFNFEFNFKPAYSNFSIKVEFDFDNNTSLPNRIMAIIGKNGTGKTQLMNALPTAFAQNKPDDFSERFLPSRRSLQFPIVYSILSEYPKKTQPLTMYTAGLKTKMAM